MLKVERRSSSYIFYPVVLLLTISTALILIQPDGNNFRVFTNYAVEIMFSILGSGLIFLFLKWHKLMFLSFGCVCILCLFLKSSTNPSPVYAQPNLTSDFDVIHLNISNHDWEDYDDLSDLVLNTSAELVSIQEVTPDWDMHLKQTLKDSFPYFSSIASIGFNGIAVFSKYPLINIDTFYYQKIPNLTGLLQLKDSDNQKVRFVSTYTNPSFDTDQFYQELREHFTTIISKVKDDTHAKLAMGTYNTVAWASEMKYLTNSLGLQNSKRTTNPFIGESSNEHIFHSKHLECSEFDGIYADNGSKIGLKAKLQFKNKPILNDTRTDQ